MYWLYMQTIRMALSNAASLSVCLCVYMCILVEKANRSHQQCKLYFGVFNGVIKMQVM